MKLMIFFAFALFVGASAQDCSQCALGFTDAISAAGSDAAAILRATSNYCTMESCVNDCRNDPLFAGVVQACDQLPPAACVDCLADFTDSVVNGADANAILEATRMLCQRDCISNTECRNDPTFSPITTACDNLPGGGVTATQPGDGSGGAPPVYTFVTLLSAMFFAGMAVIFN